MAPMNALRAGEVLNHPKYGRGKIRFVLDDSFTMEFFDRQGMYVFPLSDYLTEFLETRGRQSRVEKSILDLIDQDWINTKIENDYLTSEKLISKRYGSVISRDEIIERQLKWVESKFKELKVDRPDAEQMEAIATTSNRTLVTARAGSGKTRTIVNRAIFLNQFCKIDPSEIMILAFNRSAAIEILERLTKFSTEFTKCHVMTFHALAYGLVHPEESLLIDDAREGSKLLAVESIVKQLLETKEFTADIMRVMLNFFRIDWHTVVKGGWHLLNDKDQFVNFRRGLSNESMRGESIKSLGEKVIADFLFQNNFEYKYEKYFKWDRPYRPDFTIQTGENQGVVIEYFGMKGDPAYDREIIEKQQFWEQKSGWHLISYFPEDLNQESILDFEERIASDLKKLGLEPRRLTDEEIWGKIENRGNYQFSSLVSNSISKIRKRSLDEIQFSDFVDSYEFNDQTEETYLRLLVKIYSRYLELLNKYQKDDFDGLINRAVKKISDGATGFARKATQGDISRIKFIFIDEFQDFSEQFFKLTDAILTSNKNIGLFCVGDDWQAINGFAGSELKFFSSFADYFGESEKYSILSNHRSGNRIVNISNAVMKGLGTHSTPAIASAGSIRLAELKRRNVSQSEHARYDGDRLTPALIKILLQLKGEYSVAVLGHNRVSIPYFIQDPQQRGNSLLERFGERIKSALPNEIAKKVNFSTVHGFKGSQAEVVIFLDPITRSFPSIHHTWRLQRIFGVTHESLEEEELRLLYVALTRAEKHLVLVCHQLEDLTSFVTKRVNVENLPLIDWSRIDNIDIDEVVINVSSPGVGTIEIKEELRKEKFYFNTMGKSWTKYYKLETFDYDQLQRTNWSQKSHNVFVVVTFPDDRATENWHITKGKWERLENPKD